MTVQKLSMSNLVQLHLFLDMKYNLFSIFYRECRLFFIVYDDEEMICIYPYDFIYLRNQAKIREV